MGGQEDTTIGLGAVGRRQITFPYRARGTVGRNTNVGTTTLFRSAKIRLHPIYLNEAPLVRCKVRDLLPNAVTFLVTS